MTEEQKRLLGFDLLKITAIVVLMLPVILEFFHIWPANLELNLFDVYTVNNASVGVSLLLLAIGATLEYRRRQFWPIRNLVGFYLKTLLRLYPMYWAGIIIALALVPSQISRLSTLERIFGYFSGLAPYMSFWNRDMDAVTWVIGLIAILVLLHPLISRAMEKHPVWSIIAILSISTAARYLCNHYHLFEPDGYRWLPLCSVAEFALGVFGVRMGFYLKWPDRWGLVRFAGVLSWYAFLIYYPLLFIRNAGFYVVAVIVFSLALYAFDAMVQRKIVSPLTGLIESDATPGSIWRNIVGWVEKYHRLMLAGMVLMLLLSCIATFYVKPMIDQAGAQKAGSANPTYPLSFQLYGSGGTDRDGKINLGTPLSATLADDLHFYDSDGNGLSFLENYDPVGHHANVTVNLTGKPAAGTTLTMTCGDTSVSLGYDGAGISVLKRYVNLPYLLEKRDTGISAAYPMDSNYTQEPTVIYDTNPVIFTNCTSVFKMWFDCGFDGDAYVSYAESIDGVDWVRYGEKPLGNLNYNWREFVLKNPYDGYYYMYLQPVVVPDRFDRYSSRDGLNWTLDKTGVLTGSEWWENVTMGNPDVWLEGADQWYMLYEAKSRGVWRIGLATSSDGLTWTKSDLNPVLNKSISEGGPEVHKIGDTYYLILHRSPKGYLPTDIYVYESTNLINWSLLDICPYPLIERTTEDEGAGSNVSQVADPSLVEANGKTYIYYTASSDGRFPAGNGHVKVAVANMTLSELLTG